jgi:ribosomal protein S18 acetylase RimI-like enzyme
MRKFGLSATMQIEATANPAPTADQSALVEAARNAVLPAFKWPFGKVSLDGAAAPVAIRGGGTEALLADRPPATQRPSYDYWRITREGEFYSLVSLYEDENLSEASGTLHWKMRVWRTTEAILFIGRLFRELGVGDSSVVTFSIRYAGLLGRRLRPEDDLPIPGNYICHTDEVEVSVSVSIVELEAGLHRHAKRTLTQLFDAFDHCPVGDQLIDREIDVLISRTRPLTIRFASDADVQRLADLKREEEDRAYREYGTAAEHSAGLDTFSSPSYVEQLVQDENQTVILAELSGKPEGMVAMRQGEGMVWLHALYVRRKGLGIATKLVVEVGQLARDSGAAFVSCEIFERNEAAKRLFTRLGFARTGASRPSETYRNQRLVEYRAAVRTILAGT